MVSPPEGGRIGFPPGIAAKLVISKFKKWEQYSIQRKDVPVPSPAVKHEVAHTNQAPATEVAQTSQNEVKPKEVLSNVKPVPSSSKPNSSKKTDSFIKKDNEANPVGLWDAHNGRKTDKYSWSQSIKELDVYVAVHEDVKTKKQIKVEINMNFIRVVTGVGTNSEVSIDWKLSHPIIKDESYWSLHPGESIFLSLQKAKERWWDHLFEGEEPIDRTKIEAVRPMEDLEEEEQVKIQELVWNQEQKLKGLPTSDELVHHHSLLLNSALAKYAK